jgi:hypothetical protein
MILNLHLPCGIHNHVFRVFNFSKYYKLHNDIQNLYSSSTVRAIKSKRDVTMHRGKEELIQHLSQDSFGVLGIDRKLMSKLMLEK